MKHTLPALPYSEDSLSPKLSRLQLEYHHDKHHAAYVNNLNALIENSSLSAMSLEHIIQTAEGAIFNNAAQIWNHTFYFEQFSAKPKVEPCGALKEAIEISFGSFGSMKEQFSKAAISLFGSGWVWLVLDGKELTISPMSNAYTPVKEHRKPILCCDVWEHAYYIDYFNRRADYITAFWEIVDWSIIEKRYEKAILEK